MDRCLFEFTEENVKRKFESEYIKQFSPEFEDIFEFKQIIEVMKIPNIKKKTLEHFVYLINLIKDSEESSFDDKIKFPSEERAIEFFEEKKEELKWLKYKSDIGIIFDGHRYFLEINKDNKIIGRCN